MSFNQLIGLYGDGGHMAYVLFCSDVTWKLLLITFFIYIINLTLGLSGRGVVAQADQYK